MTYQSDPTRWSQSQGEDMPELLRDAFSASMREGPSDLQMRTLALKLAAVGTGAALAGGAATAKASTTAAGGAAAALKTGSAFTLGKVAASLALAGAVATGAVFVQRTQNTQPARAVVETVQQVEAPQVAEAQPAPVVAPVPTVDNIAAPVTASNKASDVAARAVESERAQPVAAAAEAKPSREQVVAHEPSAESAQANESAKAHRPARIERRALDVSTPVAAAANAPAKSSTPSVSAERVSGQTKQLSEIELLRNARAALAAHPRDAYRLAQEHKELYPNGVFAQERDALAVEALQRAGDLKGARKLAEAFVQHYPSSPHAHRFRETMNIQ